MTRPDYRIILLTCLDRHGMLAHTSPNPPRSLGFGGDSYYPGCSVGVPQSKSFRFAKMLRSVDRHPSMEVFSKPTANISPNLDENVELLSLKDLIATKNYGLDPILGTISDVARQLTGASGSALAMWKDGAMVCRARSGNTTLALGAALTTRTGISGECLRSGKIQHCADAENDPFVDMEVCRSLGLRSIAVVPIHGWRGINGILEVFSNQTAAFTEGHIALLQELAALAERARASRPQDASPAERRLSVRRNPGM